MNDYIPINPGQQNDFDDILNQINLHKNGPVSQSMSDAGLKYKVNFGVSIVDLRKIARPYAPNDTLAKLLWHKGWRETYILASLIAGADTIDVHTLNIWMNNIPNTEIAEQLGNNLLAYRNNGEELQNHIVSEDNLKRIAIFKSFAKRFLLKNDNFQSIFLSSLELNEKTGTYHKRDLAVALGQACAYYFRLYPQYIKALEQKIELLMDHDQIFKISKELLLTEQYLIED